jgi:FHA domain
MVRHILRSLNQPFEYELHSGLNTVGRNPTNDFRIPEASVSSFHAEIEVSEGGKEVKVRDLQSTNGTFIDGQPVELALLLPGHLLQLGSVELRLDSEEFEIKVPVSASLVAQAQGALQALPDGTLACSRNPNLPATHQAIGGCQAVVRCPGVFNIASMRAMKLSGGSAGQMLFCPDCNAKCEPIPGVTDKPEKRPGLFARLTQTVQLGWKKK